MLADLRIGDEVTVYYDNAANLRSSANNVYYIKQHSEPRADGGRYVMQSSFVDMSITIHVMPPRHG